MKSFAVPWLFALALVGGLGIASKASAQTADCQAEAESVSGAYVSMSTTNALPGSVSGSGEPGASNAGSGNRENLRAIVYDACLKRRAASDPRRSPDTSAPETTSASGTSASEKTR